MVHSTWVVFGMVSGCNRWDVDHVSSNGSGVSRQEGVFDWSPEDEEQDGDVDLDSSLRGDDLPEWSGRTQLVTSN